METTGDRVYGIRKALGPNARKALSQDAFAALLSKHGHRQFYGPEISLIEQNKKPLSLDDAADIMAVDPEHRSIDWLRHGQAGSVGGLAKRVRRPVSEIVETPVQKKGGRKSG